MYMSNMEKTNEQIVKEYHEKLLKKREYAKRYYAKNKEKISQNQKKRYLENKQKYQNYYLDNKERYRNYYLENKEKIINVAKTHYYNKKQNNQEIQQPE